MGGSWSAKNLKTQTQFKPKWNHQPTEAVRVPACFKEQVLGLAQKLDNGELDNKSSWATNTDISATEVLIAAKFWEIEEILKLQSELPQIISWKKEQSNDRRLEKALIFLAGCCDGALSSDGAGFNKCDSGFGKWLASRVTANQPLLRSHAEAGLKMIRKYTNQVEGAGFSLPEWEAIAHQYPENSLIKFVSSEVNGGFHTSPKRRVQVDGNEIAVYCPYDSTGKFQHDAKSIEGYRFCGENKSWCYPLDKVEEVLSKLITEDFVVSPDIEGIVELAKAQRAQAEAVREAEALLTASEIVKLVKSADLDAPMSNGWYLRDYQKSGVEWLLAHRKEGIFEGGILADDMGLGKTLTALYAAKAMQKQYECAVFVVCPVSLMEGWRRAADIAQVGIELFSNNYQKIPAPLENQKYILICDEAHYFQDTKSKRTEKMLELAKHKNCLAAWMLTGTPIKNGRPINLMPLLMAVGHPLVQDKWAYMKRYCNAHKKNVKGRTVWDFTGAAFLNELSEKTEDVMLRRKKSEVLTELPAKTRLFRSVELEAKDEKAYRDEITALIQDYRDRAKRGKVDEDAEALVTLNILRNIGSKYKVAAALDYTQELLEQGQQVVIFTEFLDSAKAIHRELMNLGIGHCELLTGETKTEERQSIVDRFQLGESKVFVGTIKAGGVGLTLTAASNVLLVDRAWTPGDVEQAEDRCHRLGQQSAVFATWLQLGQIDLAIDGLLVQKSDRIELILKGKRKTLRGINSPVDLAKELLAVF